MKTGNRVAPTAPVGDSSNRAADTAFVAAAIASATGPLTPFPTPSGTGSLIWWNGTAWVALAGNSSGTAYLTENSSGIPSFVAAIPGTLVTTNNFTVAGTYTATIATGATKGYVKLWGGPGGSHATAGITIGGGGPGYLEKLLTGLTAGSTLALTLGAAGANGTSPTDGAMSTLSSGSQTISTLTAAGGGAASSVAPGAGGTASGGDFDFTGQVGATNDVGGTTVPAAIVGVSGGGYTGVGCIIMWLS